MEIIVRCHQRELAKFSRSEFLFTQGGAHLQSGQQWAHFDACQGPPSFLPGNLFNALTFNFLCQGDIIILYHLLLFGGILHAVFVGGVVAIVVVVVVVVVDGVAVAALFPLFLCNHA